MDGAHGDALVLDGAAGERLMWMGDPTVLKVTAKETGGRYSIAEVVSTPDSLVPKHVHHNEDEAFYILEGEVTFWVGEFEIKATPGSFLVGPRTCRTVMKSRARRRRS